MWTLFMYDMKKVLHYIVGGDGDGDVSGGDDYDDEAAIY